MFLLLTLLATVWTGVARGQGPGPDDEIRRFLEERTREPSRFPLYPADAPQETPHPRSTSPQADLGDWSMLAFSSYRDSTYEIYTAQGDGSNQLRRTWNEDFDYLPRFDRGTTQITFVSYRDGNAEIYRMNTDGSNQTRLTWSSDGDFWPIWSPDGSQIVFYSYRDGNAEIYVMNADGSNQTRLTTNLAWDGYPTWSPDGSQIAFASDRSGQSEIWMMDADGSNQEQISSGLDTVASLDWSPDGSRLAFNDDFNNDGWLDLAIINVDGTELTHPLGSSPAYYDYMAPTWAPHGEDLAFCEVQWIYSEGSWYWVDAFIYGLDLDTNSPYLLIGSGYDWWPEWETSDATAPSSEVTELPAWSLDTFTLQWSGSDNQDGAGLAAYDVQIREGLEGEWTDWITETTVTTSTFTGEDGQTYYFRSRARDHAYNEEPYPEEDGDTFTTIDTRPPTSTASSPAYATGAFTVTWEGIDDGSSVATYDVQYRDGPDGEWVDWILDTEYLSATFSGGNGHTYYFQSRARDELGNEEPYPGEDGDTATTVDADAPSSSASSPEYASAPTFQVTWSGDDGGGSGIAFYDVQYRDGTDGVWTDWLTETTVTAATFTGELSHTYYFQCRAQDNLGNQEPYPGGDGDSLTHTPRYALHGTVLGNRDQPIAMATITTTPPALDLALSQADGEFTLYFNKDGEYSLEAIRDGFGSLPPMQNVLVTETAPMTPTLYLPPIDDVIIDGGFEAGDLVAWSPAGDIPPVLTPTAHTGDFGAAFGGAAPAPVVTPTDPFTISENLGPFGGYLTTTLVEVLVPPGALSETAVLTLTGVPTITGLNTAIQDVGLHFALTAAFLDGSPLTETLIPLTFTLFYEDADWQAAQVDGEESLDLWRYDTAQEDWVPLNGTVDEEDNMVTAAGHPGLFALLGTPYDGPWTGNLEQVVTPTMTSGTLSLLYRVEGADPASDTLQLHLVDPTQAVSYTLPLTESGWVHRWWDLPDDAGPTVTVRLEWVQEERERPVGVIVDEVSLGSSVTGSYPIFLPLLLRE